MHWAPCGPAPSDPPGDPLIRQHWVVIVKGTGRPLSDHTVLTNTAGLGRAETLLPPRKAVCPGVLQGSPGVPAILVLVGKQQLSMQTCAALRRGRHSAKPLRGHSHSPDTKGTEKLSEDTGHMIPETRGEVPSVGSHGPRPRLFILHNLVRCPRSSRGRCTPQRTGAVSTGPKTLRLMQGQELKPAAAPGKPETPATTRHRACTNTVSPGVASCTQAGLQLGSDGPRQAMASGPPALQLPGLPARAADARGAHSPGGS